MIISFQKQISFSPINKTWFFYNYFVHKMCRIILPPVYLNPRYAPYSATIVESSAKLNQYLHIAVHRVPFAAQNSYIWILNVLIFIHNNLIWTAYSSSYFRYVPSFKIQIINLCFWSFCTVYLPYLFRILLHFIILSKSFIEAWKK